MCFARAVALLVVLALTGPSMAAAACELTCALGSHHHGTSSSSEASCHGHQSATLGLGLSAGASAACHESGDLPSAIVDAALSTLVLPALPATFALDPVVVSGTIARVNPFGTLFGPRPAHRPLRV
jgi:hypothetical protein